MHRGKNGNTFLLFIPLPQRVTVSVLPSYSLHVTYQFNAKDLSRTFVSFGLHQQFQLLPVLEVGGGRWPEHSMQCVNLY